MNDTIILLLILIVLIALLVLNILKKYRCISKNEYLYYKYTGGNDKMDHKFSALLNNKEYNQKIRRLVKNILRGVNIDDKLADEFLNKYKNQDDKTIVNKMRKLINQNDITDAYDQDTNIKRAEHRFEVLNKQIGNLKITRILDYGGGRGDMVEVFGKRLGLSKENTLVIDVPEWSGRKNTPNPNVTFYDISHLEKLKDKSISLITCFHVLHHIEPTKRNIVIAHFYRILSPGGLLIIGEHDSYDNWPDLIDIEHMLYDVVTSQNMTYDEFKKEFYADYLSENEWHTIIHDAGFVNISTEHLHNKDNSFWLFANKST